jgi:sigma-B regulation protein RsbU (phosphoserine phosphatase)
VAEWEKDEISYAGGDDFPASRVEVRELTEGGPVLGIFEDCLYEQETVSLESGDLLLAYTDGLTESLNAEGLEFGEERLRKTLAALAHLSADEVRRHVVEEVQAWCRGTQQHDDLTFVVLKVK